MLIIYGGRRGGSRVKELAEAAECLEADAWLGGDHHDAPGGLLEHPGGDLQGAGVVEVQPAVEGCFPVPQALAENVDLPAEPGMERIADRTDIDQSGLVLRSSTTNYVPTRARATSP
jgi:hypothetical protein